MCEEICHFWLKPFLDYKQDMKLVKKENELAISGIFFIQIF